MKKYIITSRIPVFLLIISIILINTSCKKKTTGEKPELPPVESLVMDFSDFDSRPDQKKSMATTYNNFVYSYLNVAFWSTVSTGAVALPAVAYSNLLNQEAEKVDDNIWKWTYNFTWDGVSYVASLTTERLNNEEYTAELVIAFADSPESGFKWVEGIVRYDRTAASWNVYKHNEGDPVQLLDIDWTKDYETGVSSLTYVYVEPGQPETGSSITYGRDPSLDYNATYTIILSAQTIEIQWDTETKAGRVRNPYHFEDNDWHCWNSDLVDIECPAL